MTEPSPSDLLGGFRTPLGAGMLSGVLAGAIGVLLYRTGATEYAARRGGITLGWAVWLPTSICLFAGPAIAQRSWRLFVRVLLWGVALAFAAVMLPRYLRSGLFGPEHAHTIILVDVILPHALLGAIHGLGLKLLYVAGPHTAYVVLLAAVGRVAFSISYYVAAFLATGQLWKTGEFYHSEEGRTVIVMLLLLGPVVMVVLPTWAIERAMRLEQRAHRRVPMAAVSESGL